MEKSDPSAPVNLEPSPPLQGSPPLAPGASPAVDGPDPKAAAASAPGAPQAPKPGVKADAPALTPPPAGSVKPPPPANPGQAAKARPTVRCDRCGRQVPYDPADIPEGGKAEVRVCRGAEWHSVKGVVPKVPRTAPGAKG